MKALSQVSPVLTTIVVIVVGVVVEWILSNAYGWNRWRTVAILTILVLIWAGSVWASKKRSRDSSVADWGRAVPVREFRKLGVDKSILLLGFGAKHNAPIDFYLPRKAVPLSQSTPPLSEKEIVSLLQLPASRIGVLDRARGGKSRYLNSLLKQVSPDHILLIPNGSALARPPECLLHQIEKRNVIIVIDDVDLMSSTSANVESVIADIETVAMSVSTLFTGRKGDELEHAIEQVSGIRRFIDSARLFELAPLNREEKRRLALGAGRTWNPFDENRFALLSEILEHDEMHHAASRFASLGGDEKAFLRVLKLLDQAGVFDTSADLVVGLLESVFSVTFSPITIEFAIDSLTNAGFLRQSGPDRIVPEYAYLRKESVVPYFLNRVPDDDLLKIAQDLIRSCKTKMVSKIVFYISEKVSHSKAIDIIDILINRCDVDSEIPLQKAMLLLNDGQGERALEILEHVEDDSSKIFIEIKVLESLDRYGEATELILNYFSVKNINWKNLNRPKYSQDILQDVEYALNMVPPKNVIPSRHMFVATLANCFANIGRFQEALVAWESFLGAYPDHRLGLKGKARALFFLGRVDDAMETLAVCIKKWPDSDDAWHLQAQIELKANRAQFALASINRAKQLSPSSLGIRKTKIDILEQLGDDYDFINETLSALELEPEDFVLKRELGRKFYKVGEDAKAILWLAPLLEEGVQDPDLLEVLANAYANADDWPNASEVLQIFQEGGFRSGIASGLMAETYHHLGEH